MTHEEEKKLTKEMASKLVYSFKDEDDMRQLKNGKEVPAVKYFTKQDGKGKQVKSVMSIGSKDNRMHYNREELTKDEKLYIKRNNFRRLGGRRTTGAVKSIRSLCNVANGSMHKWTEEEAGKILETLQTELAVLESKLLNVKEEKEDKGYQFTF